ncbi:MAG: MFS transporter [Candidatus Gracilibacteria bacterium]|nr:MFS transporter [Candidatus Gracilibacteria bacterium]
MKLLDYYKKLDDNYKAMFFIGQTYYIGSLIGGVFVNLFIYKYYGEISGVITLNLMSYLFSILSMFFYSTYISKKGYSIKKLFKVWFIFSTIAYIFLMLLDKSYVIFVFGFLFGLGNGAYWIAMHSYELNKINKNIRDFYSSITSVGNQINSILIPFLISILFLIGDLYLKISAYPIIFGVLILFNFLSFLRVDKLKCIFPPKIKIGDIFSNFKKSELLQYIYFLFYGLSGNIIKINITLIMIYILKTELNIGLFQTFSGILSIIISIFLSKKRNENNRLKIMTIFGFLIFINFIFLGFNLTIFGISVFLVLNNFLLPGFTISARVFGMKYMKDINQDESNFFSRIVFRELILIIGRVIFFLSVLFFIYYLKVDTYKMIVILTFLSGFIYLFTLFFLYLEEKRLKNI